MPASKVETGVWIELKRLVLTPLARKHQAAMLDKDKSLTQGKLAKTQGMSQPRMNDYLAITRLPNQVGEVIRYLINLKLDHLVQICRLKTPQDQIEVAKMASDGGWTVRKL